MMKMLVKISLLLFPLQLAAQGMLLNPSMSFGGSTLNNSLVAVWELEETSGTRNGPSAAREALDQAVDRGVSERTATRTQAARA